MSRRILNARRFETGFGTHKYDVKFEGEWSDMDLITAINNGKFDNPMKEDLVPHHYGGYVKRFSDGKSAMVSVYYD